MNNILIGSNKTDNNKAQAITITALSGSGGGGGGGKSEQPASRKPIEAADNLYSSAKAEIVLALCEGEIEGLADGNKSVYINETPLQNQDGSLNFQAGSEYYFNTGTPTQPNYPIGVATATAVGQIVSASTPVIRTLTNPAFNEVRVVLSSQAFSQGNQENGDISGTLVTLRIKINGVVVLEPTIQGKSSALFERQYSFNLNSISATGPWNIEVSRITPDATSSLTSNTIVWSSYSAIIHSKLNYPNTATAAFKLDAKQFTNIPSIYFLIKGRKIRIPTNASVDAVTGRLSYQGLWDGTFKIAWCSCPAWCLYDLLINNRYGLGFYITAENIDKWSLYSISTYCNELVNDGYNTGGTEARFSCNLVLQTAEEAYKVLRDFASIFNGLLFFTNGTIKSLQDRANDPIVKTFSNANVIDGLFTYAGTDRKAIHTTAEISWINPNNFYKLEKEFVSIDSQVNKYGVRPLDTIAYGCTSRGQAHRQGLYQLLTEQLQDQAVTFSTGPEGAQVEPGMLISIQDTAKGKGKRFGGRIKDIDYSTGIITTDSPVTLEQSKTYQLYVSNPSPRVKLTGTINASGASEVVCTISDFLVDKESVPGAIGLVKGNLSRNNTRYIFERYIANTSFVIADDFISDKPKQSTQPITNSNASTYQTNKLSYAYGWNQDPDVNSIWSLEEITSVRKTFKIISRKENNNGSFQIEAIRHSEEKYALIEQALALNPTLSPVPKPRVPMISGVNTAVYTYNPPGSGSNDTGLGTGTGAIIGLGAPPVIAPSTITPTGLSVTRRTLSILLEWITPSVSTESILIYRAINTGAFTLYQSLSGGTSKFTDTNLSPSTTYKYFFVAKNSAGNAPNSASIEGFMPAQVNAPFQTIMNSVGQTASANPELTMNWQNVAGVDYWSIYRTENGDANKYFLTNVANNVLSFTDTNVGYSQYHGYYVTGVNAGGKAPFSSQVVGLTRSAPVIVNPTPPPPSPSPAVFVGGNTFNFTAGGNVDTFYIYYWGRYSDNSIVNWVFVGTVPGWARSVTIARENNDFAVSLIAVGPGGASNPSSYTTISGGNGSVGYPTLQTSYTDSRYRVINYG